MLVPMVVPVMMIMVMVMIMAVVVIVPIWRRPVRSWGHKVNTLGLGHAAMIFRKQQGFHRYRHRQRGQPDLA